MAKTWGLVSKYIERTDDLFTTFYGQVASGERMTEDNEFDAARQAVDASFFPYYFHEIRIVIGTGIPPGHRATWGDRHKLAVAKHFGDISSTTADGEFPGILLDQQGSTDKDRFIEVHTFGKLDLSSIERFTAPKPTNRDDQVLAKRFKRKLREQGADVKIG